MIPYYTTAIADSRIREAREKAEARRLRRAFRTRREGSRGSEVIDALGHGLIAIGSRLVSDPSTQPPHRRAA